mgnify:CR=1 FL=1
MVAGGLLEMSYRTRDTRNRISLLPHTTTNRPAYGKENVPPWTSFIIRVEHLLKNALSNGNALAVMTNLCQQGMELEWVGG